MLSKNYEHQEVEKKLADKVIHQGSKKQKIRGGKFSMALPPPNVTGSLHMGHALNTTLQDILARYNRMLGKEVLWQPGVDHAGIATQMLVVKHLAAQGISKESLGREKFVEQVWAWKEKYGSTIVSQLKSLGAICNWDLMRFTLDDQLSKAVLDAFVKLYNEGIIYRAKRLVNWDCKLQTAVSDLEVRQKEEKGKLWYFAYPYVSDPQNAIVIATTRPETMFGDVAVAVNPEDERYKRRIGERVYLPLTGRTIPIVADQHAAIDQGTGAVKITPGHDFNDFEVGQRHNLPCINIMDPTGCLNEQVPEAFAGLERFAAREKTLAAITEQGLLVKTEEIRHSLPYGDRSHTITEPRLTNQWMLNSAQLVKPAIEAVEKGEIEFVPGNWSRTYFEWLNNIRPWCISRQLWWGHQIPAWYGPDKKIFVAYNEEEAAAQAEQHYGQAVELERDPDVLDTWFSSSLWPFATLGWPEKTNLLQANYPTDTLFSAFDIIFFWIARMIMMGIHFTKQIPFKKVYIHALVLDAKGEKMSKSKGNVVNPLEVTDQYGTDALRFTLCALAIQGSNINLNPSWIAGYRNFMTKIWNVARLCQMNDCLAPDSFQPNKTTLAINHWILLQLKELVKEVTSEIEAYRFNEVGQKLYHFVWHSFCDWYLEMSKIYLYGSDEKAKKEVQQMTGWCMKQVLLLLHPVVPFITTQLWPDFADQTEIADQYWPEPNDWELGSTKQKEIEQLVKVVTEIRSAKGKLALSGKLELDFLALNPNQEQREWVENNWSFLKQLGRLSSYSLVTEIENPTIKITVGALQLMLRVKGKLDFSKELARLDAEISGLEKRIGGIDSQLSNPILVAKAAKQFLTSCQQRKAEAEASLAKLRSFRTQIN